MVELLPDYTNTITSSFISLARYSSFIIGFACVVVFANYIQMLYSEFINKETIL